MTGIFATICAIYEIFENLFCNEEEKEEFYTKLKLARRNVVAEFQQESVELLESNSNADEQEGAESHEGNSNGGDTSNNGCAES